jgi:hypothetical protein
MLIPPSIAVHGLPGEEQPHAHLLCTNLAGLSSYVGMLRDALGLVDHLQQFRVSYDQRRDLADPQAAARANRQVARWQQLVIFQGAIIIHNFDESGTAINKLVGRCPAIEAHMDDAEMKKANAAFHTDFKNHADVRLDVATAASSRSLWRKRRGTE